MPLCTCELICRTALGVIENEETVGRLIFSPDHLQKKDNGVKPGAFPVSHIQSLGLSLARLDKMSATELGGFANAVATQKQGRTWVGTYNFCVSSARAIVDAQDDRLVCLFDDPTPAENSVPANPAHALLVASCAGMSELDAKEVRSILVQSGVLLRVGDI